jgi:hypothetical protein
MAPVGLCGYDAGTMTTRRFTFEEANDLVPRLELEFTQIAQARQRAAAAADLLGGMDEALALLKGKQVLAGKQEAAERFAQATAELVAAVERVNSLGCLVQDVEMGHVDFPAERLGKTVHLCWLFGEPQVAHVHEPSQKATQRERLAESGGEPWLLH